MSEAVLAPATSQRGRQASARGRRNRLNALEALEQGFALFKSSFGWEAWRYFSGAAPLVLCFIPIWVLNGQIRLSDGALLAEAALLTGAYLLRAWSVASYMHRIRERAFGVPRPAPAAASAKLAAIGRLLAWKIVLSSAALVGLTTIAGATWCYGACQFASLEAIEDGSKRHSLGDCVALSSQWFGGGLLLFLMLLPLWIAVWLNGLIVALLVPQLLHSIFGLNTLLSTPMGMYALSRSSAFWLSLFAGAWLALDPIVKCSFVVVYQHLQSRREGDDLRGLLASLPRERQKKAQMIASTAAGSRVATRALVVLAAILVGTSSMAAARAAQAGPAQRSAETTPDTARDAQIQKLRRALDEESGRAIYRWHDPEHPSPPTWFDKLLVKIQQRFDRLWDAFQDFLRKLWPRGLNLSPGQEKEGAWKLKDVRLWLTLIAILTIGAGAALFWLRRRRDAATQLSIPLAIAPLPDLSDGAVASERSEDEWFALADRLEREGDLRLALRSVYLGLLAGLAQREWLSIRRDRTNRDYLNEFTRRWRRRPQAALERRLEIPEKLRGSLRQFDRVWYGSHVPTREAVAAYRQDQRELLNLV
ncbi:MAG TPA: DUF4129 domain-containing protein [Candidatus Sulfotelmatobacter sp.]|jgi:hypothetical protein|nr:DUF4129 domain-containing protein [Candidatus Sulfotelmatobacter sp.]